jgi:alanyl-tRNA synthetase
MKIAEIRNKFLKYFERLDHELVASSSLIPSNDPTLLFTNAGMVQFKDIFLGNKSFKYVRAASSQRCVRAGGKHNDLENVGYTARHHTFFEMLGNFSFGDYFKREAIMYAWRFLTEELELPEDRLWVTVHESDDEAAQIWLEEVGVSPDRFSRLGEDNFWQMSDTGPCGPSSEIFYDHGEDIPGGPPGSDNDHLDRYIEIWNLVFMQYDRKADGSMDPLPKPSIDTGMGLERIAAVMQGVHNNYEIDLFQVLLKAAARVTCSDDLESKSLRVIADHIRSCSFMIADGVLPSNEGRGYVLRRIIRRAIRHGNQLGKNQPFFSELVVDLAGAMGEAYPELIEAQAHIKQALFKEELQFQKTLHKGMLLLNTAISELNGNIIAGDTVFTLYDTYGFPVDLINDIAREKNLSLDMPGYEKSMTAQRERARAAGNFNVSHTQQLTLDGETKFTGYQATSGKGSIKALLLNGAQVDNVFKGDEVVIVLDSTSFYAESGGQTGDHGLLRSDSGELTVTDCQKQGAHFLHIGIVTLGSLSVNQKLESEVNVSTRLATGLNHSATHLLHATLRKVLGEHVVQKGSLVDGNRLRFDFSHAEPIAPEQRKLIERIVNEEIRRNTSIKTEICDMEEAQNKGAMSLFGEKYGDEVRVLTIGNGFSIELCGGTHALRTGDIGLFKIISEAGISSGVRRIEAVTGESALSYIGKLEQDLEDVCRVLKTSSDSLAQKVAALSSDSKELEKQNTQLKSKMASIAGMDLLSTAKEIKGIKVLSANISGVDPKTLRNTVDQLKNKLGASVVMLATVNKGKVSLVSGATQDVSKHLHAGELMEFVVSQMDGKGGGRHDMAQGGSSNAEALPEAINSVFGWIEKKLSDCAID